MCLLDAQVRYFDFKDRDLRCQTSGPCRSHILLDPLPPACLPGPHSIFLSFFLPDTVPGADAVEVTKAHFLPSGKSQLSRRAVR